MNQYLLLRNNKKSGPFSASELASMGLKPFDLIWLEGKSAAWRYPGEIDELKPFAPPVEEQPYDRFYNKKRKEQAATSIPDKQPPANITTVHAQAHVENEKSHASRIFVAVPERPAKNETITPPRHELRNEEKETLHAGYLPPLEPNQPKDPESKIEAVRSSPVNIKERQFIEKPARSNVKVIYWSIAAMFVFAIATAFIYLNYQEQQKQLKKLNELVLNMQQNQSPETNPLSKNVVATFPIDAAAVMHDSMKTEMTLVPSTDQVPVKKAVTRKKAAIDSPAISQSKKTDTISGAEELPEKNIIEERPSIKKEFNRKNIGQFVHLSANKYRVGLLGGVSDLKLTLTNKSQVTFDKVEVQLEFLGPENKVIKTQMVNFENVASGSSMTLDIPRSGRGVSVKYNIASIQKEDEVIALF